jgi:hypothetical protein
MILAIGKQQYHRANPNHPLITVWLDKKQDWQNMNISNSSRSPWRLDSLIVSYFYDWEVFKPPTGRPRIISAGPYRPRAGRRTRA